MAYNLGQQVYQILAMVMDHEIAKNHFNEPVDPVALGIPDYADVIKEPMDLGTIRSRLVSGYYRHPSEVYGDVHRVWHNCRTYNDPHSAIVAECNQLASYFEGMWRKLDFGAQQQQQQQAAAGAQAGPLGEALSFRRQLQQHVAAEQGAQQALPLGQQGSLGGSLEGGALSPRSSMQAHGRHKPPGAAAAGAAVAAAASKSALRAGHPLKRCLTVLDQLLQLPAGRPFLGPDPNLLVNGHPHPTELGTIRDRLAPGLDNGWGTISYKATSEVLGDVRLVFAARRAAAAADEARAALCDAAEREFSRLWAAAGLPTEQGGHAELPTSPTASAQQHSKGHHKRPATTQSADGPAGAAAAAAGAAAKRPKKGGGGKGSQGPPVPRCDVCARSKKGKCGTESAPKSCRRRVAKAQAAQAAAAAAAAAAAGAAAQGQPPQAGSAGGSVGAPLATAASLDATAGGSSQHLLITEPSAELLSGDPSLDPAAYAAAAMDAALEQHTAAERYAEAAAEAAAAATAGSGADAARRPRRAVRGPVMVEEAGGSGGVGSQAAAHGGSTGGGKGSRGKAPGEGGGGGAAAAALRDREVLAAWARLQRKRETAVEAAAAAQEAARALADAREILEAVEQLEHAEEEQVGAEVATPWLPSAQFVRADYDVTAAAAAAGARRMVPLLRLGAYWLGSVGGAQGVGGCGAAPGAACGTEQPLQPGAAVAVKVEDPGPLARLAGTVAPLPGVKEEPGREGAGPGGDAAARRQQLAARALGLQHRLRDLVAQRGLPAVLEAVGAAGAAQRS